MKVKVETTTEFPLDILCTLMFTKEDDEEYEKLLKEAEEKIAVKALNINGQEIAVEEMENLNDEV